MIKKLINSKLGQQIIKFGAVGFLCFFIEYVLLILFKELLGWPVIAANTLAFTVSAIVNYILSILFVFDTDKKANQGKQFAVFFIFAVGGLILNNVVLKLGTMVLDPFWSRSYIIVKPFATGVVMVYNFITRKIFIEKKPEKEEIAKMIQQATDAMGGIVCINDLKPSGHLQIVKEVRDNLKMSPIGTIRLSINSDALEQIRKNVNFASEGAVLILDEKNQIVQGQASVSYTHLTLPTT